MALALFIQGITVLVLFWAHDLWMFYIFAILFGIGFGGEMSAYLVVNRQYFGSGPIATCYGFQVMGAFAGHAVATGLAGLVLYATGSYGAILALFHDVQLRRGGGHYEPGAHFPLADTRLARLTAG